MCSVLLRIIRNWKKKRVDVTQNKRIVAIISKQIGNTKRVSFPPLQEAIEGLRDFMENLVTQHSEERATRLVRESLTTLERGDSHVVHLASIKSHEKKVV